jgi:phosphatidylethanolamine-binding protein
MTTDITFGPPGQEWHYSPSTKTYDLSGGSAKKLTIPTTEGPKALITLAPEKMALVIVDMQNFFLDPSCMDHPNGLKAVEPTIKVIEKCRYLGIQVYFYSSWVSARLLILVHRSSGSTGA